MRADKVYLVGFMGAGKTSLARELARRLDWKVEDVDDRIESHERRTVREIFAQSGETHFRMIERLVVRDLLPLRHVVVATGGGTFVDADNRAAIMADGTVFWLDVPFQVLLDRIPLDGSRPLAPNRTQMEQLYLMRLAAYVQAHVRLDGARQSVGELADVIIEWLGA
ncbi:MAG: shikimate kinase [Acidobacteria bacterium]|nr:shikimate kinase [Acidobacteriota bacterium]